VDDERVYTVGHSGLVKCFRVEDGSEIWSVDLPEQGFEVTNWGVATSPLLREKTILIDMGAVLALDKKDGSIVMRTAMPTPGWSEPSFGAWSSPAVFCDEGRNLVASFNNSELVVAVEETGEILDRAPWMNRRTTNIATPLILDGDDIFITTGYNVGSARFSFDDGKLQKLWQTENLASHSANAIPHEGYIYGFDGNLRNPTRMVCVDLETGEEVWGHQDAEKLGAGTLIRASDKLIILGETGWLTIAEATPEGFRPLSQAHILKDEYCWTPPTLANGRLYCRSFNRRNRNVKELVCIQAGGN
jgi:outer membrane protein assembly factor BamB